MKKMIDLFILALPPMILSLFILIAWLFSFSIFRHFFKFPWGNDGSPYPLSLRELFIYNGVQLLFVCLLFLASITIYRWATNRLAISKTSSRGALIGISISWVIFSFLAYSLSAFFCCPGLFPEVANSLWWLTSLEFAVFAILGVIYLRN